ncbi:MAG TPA: hypothetical protein PKE27_17445 [Povalibacter sp.]|uniref:hypothetical protein n=1 Tax=Povalibacter sp. TaxID=1962978 RepID=UPI002C1DCB65|nr:hypothetical protein [Povalibacter sp.]HMN46367.1 hypothetical protein [Povalibacter sp.]
MNYKVLIAASLVAAIAAAGEGGELPSGWVRAGTSKHCEVTADSQVVSTGARSLLLKCDRDESGFVTVMQTFGAEDYRGKRMRFSADVRADSVTEGGGLWMRIDGAAAKMLAFDNMQSRPIKGTRDWQRYSVVLDVADEASAINFGLLMSGKGRLWMDDLKLEPVGTEVPVTGASVRLQPNLDLSR